MPPNVQVPEPVSVADMELSVPSAGSNSAKGVLKKNVLSFCINDAAGETVIEKV